MQNSSQEFCSTKTNSACKPPYLILDATEVNPNDIYHSVIQLESLFNRSTVISDDYKLVHELQHRKSFSLYSRRTVSTLADPIRKIIARENNAITETLGIAPIRQYVTKCDCTVFQDGDFFLKHQDFAPYEIFQKKYTWVYYFHKEPRSFQGGDIIFYDGDEVVGQVTPISGMLIVFSASTSHEVSTVQVPTQAFADSRFALTGFVSEPPSLGYRIFSKVMRTKRKFFLARNTA